MIFDGIPIFHEDHGQMGSLPTKNFVNSIAVFGKPLGLANFAEKSKPDGVVTRGKGSATV